MPKFIHIGTEVPGPGSREVLAGAIQHMPCNPSISPVVIDHGAGALLTDIDANTFVDLGGGGGGLAVGQTVPRVAAALHDQVDRFLSTGSMSLNRSLVNLAERINMAVPINGSRMASFTTTAAEAVEHAVGVARAYTGNNGVVAFEGSVHGRAPASFEPGTDLGWMAPDVYTVPYAYCYRCPCHREPSDCGAVCAEALEQVPTGLAAGGVAAIILEPVQVAGGVLVPPAGYLRRVEEICRTSGVLLIADETLTGFGRSGTMFASEILGLSPDLVCFSGSADTGIPIAGVAGRAEIMEAAGSMAGWARGGNPLGFIATIEVLNTIEQEDLAARARPIGDMIRSRWQQLQDECQLVGDVRGLGTMIGIELVRDRGNKEPAPKETSLLVKKCTERGVMPLTVGTQRNVICLLAPLAITDPQMEEALAVMECAMREVSAAVEGQAAAVRDGHGLGIPPPCSHIQHTEEVERNW